MLLFQDDQYLYILYKCIVSVHVLCARLWFLFEGGWCQSLNISFKSNAPAYLIELWALPPFLTHVIISCLLFLLLIRVNWWMGRWLTHHCRGTLSLLSWGRGPLLPVKQQWFLLCSATDSVTLRKVLCCMECASFADLLSLCDILIRSGANLGWRVWRVGEKDFPRNWLGLAACSHAST